MTHANVHTGINNTALKLHKTQGRAGPRLHPIIK
jgi:hypothetical protein